MLSEKYEQEQVDKQFSEHELDVDDDCAAGARKGRHSVGEDRLVTEQVNELICSVCQDILNNTSAELEKVGMEICLKCEKTFCVHFASKIDPLFCQECMHDVTLTEEKIVRIDQHYNEETDQTYITTHKAKLLKLSGEDWLFAQRRIDSLTDEELVVTIEYHRSIMQTMLMDREIRKVKKYSDLRNVKINFGSATISTSTTSKVVKQTKISKSTPQQINAAALLETLKKSGLSNAQIMAMIGKK